MRGLSASELLTAWERGQQAGPMGRALALLSEFHPESDVETLSSLSIGQRDSMLLRLREWTFGPQLTALSTCAACGEQIELSLNSADLLGPDARPEISLNIEGFDLRLRPPTSSDVAAANHPDLSRARLELLERCLLEARYEDSAVEPANFPEAVLDAAELALAEADPQANIQLSLECPTCGTDGRWTFDIVSFFWREIEAWAGRLFREVHTLARAYGWSEREILALSPARRQCYIDLVET
jgi:hypothetical protein